MRGLAAFAFTGTLHSFCHGAHVLPRHRSCSQTHHIVRTLASATPAAEYEPAVAESQKAAKTARLPRILSGVQPTGNLHLGNYLGAVRGWVDAQESAESFFAVVDMHAITTGPYPGLRQSTLRAAAMYLACGIDPAKSSIFVQSQIGAHAELMWLLSCVTPHGWLSRMIQFKEKSRRQGESSSMGLFAYPILQAADVLLYKPDVVPVGEDQRQHIELARNIARRYNEMYCAKRERPTFTIPELRMTEGAARIMSLDDATSKMSKSAENEGSRINLTDPPDVVLRKVKRCKTDSELGLEFDNPARLECNNLLTIYQVVTGKTKEEVVNECSELKWGQFKPLLGEALVEHLSPIRQRYEKLLKDKGFLSDVLLQGQEKASRQAQWTLDRVKKDIGFLTVADIHKMQR